MLDEQVDKPPLAADEKIVEQSQVSAQDPVSMMLRSVVTAVSANFNPACSAACCIISNSSKANFGIFDLAWEKIENREHWVVGVGAHPQGPSLCKKCNRKVESYELFAEPETFFPNQLPNRSV